MISRRELLLAAATMALLPGRAAASSVQPSASHAAAIGHGSISWSVFDAQMTALATAEASNSISQQVVVERGSQLLSQLDVNSAEFRQAVDDSYETGNRYWLWQRMLKGQNINGGILNISSDQLVQLHDHPGATGLLRIISGEAEVWQFDQVTAGKGVKAEGTGETGIAELVRVSHRVLRPGDMAVLTPNKGNIHALRAVSQQCSMLDFFIPPYKRSQRSWYEPLNNDWFDKENISCKKIPQDAYTRV